MFLFFTFCFCRVSAATHRLSPAAGEGSGRSGFSCAAWALGAGSGAGVHRLSCSAAGGIFPDQGSSPCVLHWQTDSLPLSRQGDPM